MKYLIFLCLIVSLCMVGNASALSNSGGGEWKYYKIITVNENSGTVLEDYQIPFNFYENLFPSGANPDGSDIRFVYAGKELDIWIEQFNTNDKTAKIWVKIPLIPAGGEIKIKMFYGNEKASSASNADSALVLFDEFEDGIYTDKWEVVEGNWSENDRTMEQLGAKADCAMYAKDVSITDNLIIESKLRGSDITGIAVRMIDNSTYLGSYIHTKRKLLVSSLMTYGIIRGESSKSLFNMDKDTWYIIRTTILGDNVKIEIFDTDLNLLYKETNQINLLGTGDRVGIISNSYGEWDWFRVYKYIPIEPTYTFSNEYVIQETPSIKIIKTAFPSILSVGETTTISIDVENPGNVDIKSVEILDTIPSDFEIFGGGKSVYLDTLKQGEIKTIKYSILAKEAGNFTFNPSTVYFMDFDGKTLVNWSNSMTIQVNTQTPTSTRTNPVLKMIEPDEIWVDDFSNDSLNNYRWNVSYFPSFMPGGVNYEKYHHDAREYSFTKYITEGNLHIIGDDWFSGRIYATRTINFNKPVQELRLKINGISTQGVLHIQNPIGFAIYKNESEFLRDFEPVNEKSIDTNFYEHALMSSINKEELYSEIVLKEPQRDFLFVLVAHDPWAWCDGEASQSFNTIDDIRIEGTYPAKKTSGMRILLSIICILLVTLFHKKNRLRTNKCIN